LILNHNKQLDLQNFVLWLDNITCFKRQQVQQLVAIKSMMLQAKKCGFQMDAAREINKLTTGFLAGFYPVHRLSVSGAPVLDP